MPGLAIGPDGDWFAGPPIELEGRDPALYRYLLAWHLRVFGNGNGRGDLDGDNIDVSSLEIDHAGLTGLSGDDHLTYLTQGRHAAIQGNVHGVTGDDVGRDSPIWNAAKLQDVQVLTTVPADNQVLQYFGAPFNGWGPGNAGGGPGGGITIDSVVLEQPLTGASVQFPAMAPVGSVLLAVFAEVTAAITGPPTWSLGLIGNPAAWGDFLGTSLGIKTTMADFGVEYARLVKEALTVEAYGIGASFTGGSIELTSRYIVVPGT